MTTFNTSCADISDLNGSCELNSSNQITSYTSNNTQLGTTTDITNLSDPQPHAKVTFTNSVTSKKVKYKVRGTLSGSGSSITISGSAEEDDEAKKDKPGIGDYDDVWTATAVTVQPAAAAKGN